MDRDPLDPIDRDAAIHEVFRVAAELGWIDDPRSWFEYKEWRNETAHLYDEDKARVVFNRLGRFRDDGRRLLDRLRAAFPEP